MPRKPVQHDRRRALYASTAWLVGPLLPMSSALARALIDGTDPAIEALSASLIEGRETPRERASPFTTTCAMNCASALRRRCMR